MMMIALPKSMAIRTIEGAAAFGSTCRSRMRRSRSPSAAAALTKSRARSARTWPRASRAYGGHQTTSKASIEFSMLGPRAAAIAIARISGRKREHHVDDPHGHLVEPAAEVPGKRAVKRPEDRGHDDDDGRDRERHPAAVEHAGEHVPTQSVDTEPVLGRGRAETVVDVHLGGVERGEERRHHRHRHPAEDDERRRGRPSASGPAAGGPGGPRSGQTPGAEPGPSSGDREPLALPTPSPSTSTGSAGRASRRGGRRRSSPSCT